MQVGGTASMAQPGHRTAGSHLACLVQVPSVMHAWNTLAEIENVHPTFCLIGRIPFILCFDNVQDMDS